MPPSRTWTAAIALPLAVHGSGSIQILVEWYPDAEVQNPSSTANAGQMLVQNRHLTLHTLCKSRIFGICSDHCVKRSHSKRPLQLLNDQSNLGISNKPLNRTLAGPLLSIAPYELASLWLIGQRLLFFTIHFAIVLMQEAKMSLASISQSLPVTRRHGDITKTCFLTSMNKQIRASLLFGSTRTAFVRRT